nr:reverse transcriptase domain-containing protein [Tanacetum cinerariifolium]
MFLGKYFPPSMVTKLRNEITNFCQSPDESLFEAWEHYKLLIDRCPNHNMLPVTQIDTFYNRLTLRHRDTINATACGTFMKRQINKNLMNGLQINQQVKAVTPSCETYGGPHSYNDFPATIGQTHNVYAARAYQGVEHETEVTKDTVPPTNNGSTKDVQPPVVQTKTPIPNSEPVIAPVVEPFVAPVNNQKEKIFQIFKDLDFNISFADALILMPTFGPTIKSLLTNKDKLYELARTPLDERCSVVLLKKLSEKLADPCKFLIPCDFPRMDECLALADLGASINLMPLFVWNKLSLPELTPTLMTLELVDWSISRLIGNAEDVFVKVGKFYFSADFVVVDFDADPRVPLILGRSFVKTKKALIDVYEGELTLRVGKEAITFNINQTSRYSANYNDMTANRIDVIDMACEEYSQEVIGFSDVIARIVIFFSRKSMLSSLLKMIQLHRKLISLITTRREDILLLEAFLIDDPSLPPPNQGMYLPQVRKEIKICEAKNDKSSIDEPPEVELKDLPPNLEYALLEGDDKLPVIIAKDLSVEEKSALIKVLKSHKQSISWKLFDIKGINPEFCTHKILMEDDFEPAVQHQIRVNPKIHDVIKKEFLKLLDAGLIYPISDSPWVSPVHYVPKKGGFIVGENEENELIPTRLVTGWREKSHFMVKEGILLSHKISKNRIEVDKAKVDVIAKLPHPTTVKGIRSFLGHASFYRRFIQDFSKIARSMTRLLEKDTPFFFSDECIKAFQTLKKKLTEALILISPNWDLPFELMCDASDFAIGAVLGQQKTKHFQPIHYARKTMTDAQAYYTITEEGLLAVVYAFEKFWPYLVLSKSIVYTDHSALKYLFNKQDAKPRLLRWVLLLQEFNIIVRDKKKELGT